MYLAFSLMPFLKTKYLCGRMKSGQNFAKIYMRCVIKKKINWKKQ